MKNESHNTDYHNLALITKENINMYVGYVNGKLTRFILRIIPGTNQVSKVEIM